MYTYIQRYIYIYIYTYITLGDPNGHVCDGWCVNSLWNNLCDARDARTFVCPRTAVLECRVVKGYV